MSFAYRGLGNSEGSLGEATYRDVVNDTVSAWDFLKSRPESGMDKTGICGSSWSGYLAASLPTERPCTSIFLTVPTIYDDAVYDEPHMFARQNSKDRRKQYKESFLPDDPNRALDIIRNYRGAFCMVYAENDELVPLKFTEAYWDAAQSVPIHEKHLLTDAPHSFFRIPEHEDRFREIMVEWFEKTLRA